MEAVPTLIAGGFLFDYGVRRAHGRLAERMPPALLHLNFLLQLREGTRLRTIKHTFVNNSPQRLKSELEAVKTHVIRGAAHLQAGQRSGSVILGLHVVHRSELLKGLLEGDLVRKLRLLLFLLLLLPVFRRRILRICFSIFTW